MEQRRNKACPFNPSHVVEDHRYLVHIDRCKKTAPNFHEFEQCRYNVTHYVKRGEIERHEETCPQRMIIDRSAFDDTQMFKIAELVDNTEKLNLEDWDQKACSIPFDPEKQLAKTPYMTVPQGLSKAERKTHWMKERERLQELERTQGTKEEKAIQPEERKIIDADVNRQPSSRIAARFFTTSDLVRQKETSGYTRPPSDPTPPIGRGRGLMGLLQRAK